MTVAGGPPDGRDDRSSAAAGLEADGDLDALLVFLRDARGLDFTGYKRASVARRVRRRANELRLDSLAAYRDLLEADVHEFTNLLDTMLINVTGFFRDSEAWTYLAEAIVPHIVERPAGDEAIRVWSAGCASGEEAYTIAMVMAEILGPAETARVVKIYGTDIDTAALDQARRAVYPDVSLDAVPEPLRQRYFQPVERGRGWLVAPELRRAVVFGRHDLTRDPPISRIDLLICRNTLMYFNAETQAAVIPRLHYALNDNGYLFLGRAELIVRGGAGRFSPVSLTHRIFATLPHRTRTILPPSGPDSSATLPFAAIEPAAGNEERWTTLREAAFETGAVAQLVVDPDGTLLGANEAARDHLGIGPDQIGQQLRDLRVSFDPVELRAPIERALADRASQDLGVVRHALADGRTADLNVRVLPLLNASGGTLGVGVTFTDVTNLADLRDEFHRMNQALQTAYEELQSTNEELVTSNEELQSTNEELETTNEELQSTNEELQTTNDELQAAQGVAERVNETLVEVNDELNRSMAQHQQLLDHLPTAFAVLGSRLLIEEWSAAAADMWGLRRDEALGLAFFGLDIGLPREPLQGPVRACLAGADATQTIDIEAVNRKGRHFICRVSVTPIAGDRTGEETKALLVMHDKARDQP